MQSPSALGFRQAVEQFKRRLIEVALREAGGNRTHAARRLGLQRTYLLRLIRDLGVPAPPPAPSRISAGGPYAPVPSGSGGPSPGSPPPPWACGNGPRPSRLREKR